MIMGHCSPIITTFNRPFQCSLCKNQNILWPFNFCMGHLHRITKLYASNGPWPLPFPIIAGISCGTVTLYGPFFFFYLWWTIGLRISSYQKYAEFVAPFNSNFHNKTLCESGVMWITRFVTYLSIAFPIYLLIQLLLFISSSL